MDQRTSEWLDWRRKGVGASEAGIVMGISPYKTIRELYREKVGLSHEMQPNYAMDRGNRLEPLARSQFELLMQHDFSPKIVVHPEYDFIRCSLDGWNDDLEAVVEIKCPGEADHKLALEGKIPEKYIWQLEQQAMCTGAKIVYYYSFDGEAGAVVKFEPSLERQNLLLTKLKDFWLNVENRTPPELSDKDIMQLDDLEAIEMFSKYKTMKQTLELIETGIGKLRAEMISKFAVHPRVECMGVRMTKRIRKGNVDYHKALEGLDINLEPYRKPDAVSYTITIGILEE